MKCDPPLSPKLREQIVSATHAAAPRVYTLHSAVTFTVLQRPFVIVPPQIPSLKATPPCAAALPEPDSTPLPSESGRQVHLYRKRGLRNLRIAQEFVHAIGVSPAHCWCPCRRLRKA